MDQQLVPYGPRELAEVEEPASSEEGSRMEEDQGEEYFYVRTGPSTTKMRVSKIYEFIRMRFK